MNIPMVDEMFAVLKLSCKQIRNEIENVNEVALLSRPHGRVD